MNIGFFNDHIQLPFIGRSGIEHLKRKRVLVVGAGGLGCPVISALASSGIGHIGIADGDRVETTNLARQYLYTPNQVGEFKTTAAIAHLKARYLDTTFEEYPAFLGSEDMAPLFSAYDLVIDATDNFRSRSLIGQTCLRLGLPQVYGAVFRSEGQITVFNYGGQPGVITDLFATDPATMEGLTCAESGTYVIGSMVIGMLMANEAVKVLLGLPGILAGKLVLFDVLTLQQRIIHFSKSPSNAIGVSTSTYPDSFATSLKYSDFIQQCTRDRDSQLIDVRTPSEHDHFNIGGENIPLDVLINREFSPSDLNPSFFLYCASGTRSRQAAWHLKQAGAKKVFQLDGGLMHNEQQVFESAHEGYNA